MLVLQDRLLNMPLMSLQTGTQVGATASPIIDPKNLHIVAFYCEGPLIEFSPAVIHTADIREFSSVGMIINSASDLMPPDDLVRLQEIIDQKLNLIGMRVVNEHHQKLGKVINYTVQMESYFIVKLHVRPPLLQALSVSEKLIDRSQIVSVTSEEIVVRSATVKSPIGKAQASLQNTFQQQPQPEAVKIKDS